MNTNTSSTSSRPSLTEDEARGIHARSSAFSAVGIDTVSLQAPIDRVVRQKLVHDDVTNGWIQVKAPHRGVRLTYGHGRALVFADLPLVAGCPTNEHPVEPEFAGELAQAALRAALDAAPLTYEGTAITTDSFRFTRVDVVRDFVGVDDLDDILDVIQGQLLREGTTFHRHSNGSSLAVSHSEWRAIIYDKYAKKRSSASPGDVRFELNLRTRRLQSKWAESRGGNWRRPGDITRESAYRMAHDTFIDEVRFQTAARPVSQVLPRIKTLAGKPLKQATLLGLAYEPSLLREFSRSSQGTYRPLVRAVGPLASHEQTSSYLDFESGRQLPSTEEEA